MSTSNVPIANWIQLPATGEEQAKTAQGMLDAAQDFEIDAPEVRAIADEDLARVKKLAKEVDTQRKSITGPLDAAKKAVMDLFRPRLDFLDQAERILTTKILAYDRKVAAERAQAQLAAEAAAAEERRKLEAQAAELAKQGATEAAAAVKEAAVLVQAPVIPLGPERSEQSTAKRKTWSAEGVDLMSTVKAVAEGRQPLECLQWNMPYLNGRARLEHEHFAIDGVKAVGTEGLAAKRAA